MRPWRPWASHSAHARGRIRRSADREGRYTMRANSVRLRTLSGLEEMTLLTLCQQLIPRLQGGAGVSDHLPAGVGSLTQPLAEHMEVKRRRMHVRRSGGD